MSNKPTPVPMRHRPQVTAIKSGEVWEIWLITKDQQGLVFPVSGPMRMPLEWQRYLNDFDANL